MGAGRQRRTWPPVDGPSTSRDVGGVTLPTPASWGTQPPGAAQDREKFLPPRRNEETPPPPRGS
jgi:hypothetical protein